MKKNIFTVLLLSFFIFSIPVSNAASDPVKQDGLNVTACATTYTLGMGTFLKTAISTDGFTENFLAYFTDLATRRECQLYDIFGLDSQLDAIARQIQQRYLKCELKKIPPLEKKYLQVKAEIFYVRHILNYDVKLKDVIGNTEISDASELENDPKVSAMMFNNLYDTMKKKYSVAVGGNDAFDTMYQTIVSKYASRKYQYLICSANESWKMVSDKWKEFKENWGGSKDAIADLTKGVKDEASKVKTSWQEIGKPQYEQNGTDQPPGVFKNFLMNTFRAEINDVAPEAAWDEIYENAKTYVGQPTPDLASYFTSTVNEGERFQFDMTRATLEAKYKAVYAGVTDAAVWMFIQNLDEMLATIKDTTIPIDQLNNCANKILSKQCSY